MKIENSEPKNTTVIVDQVSRYFVEVKNVTVKPVYFIAVLDDSTTQTYIISYIPTVLQHLKCKVHI